MEKREAVWRIVRSRSSQSSALVLLYLLLVLLSSAAFAEETTAPLSDFGGTGDAVASLVESPALWADLKDRSLPLGKALDRVHSRSYRVPYAPGRSLFVTEFFTLSSVLRQPARAAVFLTGPEFRGNFWSIPVEGYNGPEMAAQRGFFAYTFDYEGVGESYLPEDGSEINYQTQTAPVRTLIDRVRQSRQVDRVDLIGEGYGAEIAGQLADEPERVRSVTMSTTTYKNFNPSFAALLFTEEFELFLRSHPNGYWQPFFLDQTLANSPNEELREYVWATQPGVYPTGPILQVWDFALPTIDAVAAEVPGLVIAGEFDPIPAPGDMEELAADWGGGATLVVVPGSGHVPRIEAQEAAEQYFEALFDFIDG